MLPPSLVDVADTSQESLRKVLITSKTRFAITRPHTSPAMTFSATIFNIEIKIPTCPMMITDSEASSYLNGESWWIQYNIQNSWHANINLIRVMLFKLTNVAIVTRHYPKDAMHLTKAHQFIPPMQLNKHTHTVYPVAPKIKVHNAEPMHMFTLARIPSR
jgi:hypothetical protein